MREKRVIDSHRPIRMIVFSLAYEFFLDETKMYPLWKWRNWLLIQTTERKQISLYSQIRVRGMDYSEFKVIIKTAISSIVIGLRWLVPVFSRGE